MDNRPEIYSKQAKWDICSCVYCRYLLMYPLRSPPPLHGKLCNSTCHFQNAFWWASFRIAHLWLRGKLVWDSLIRRLSPHRLLTLPSPPHPPPLILPFPHPSLTLSPPLTLPSPSPHPPLTLTLPSPHPNKVKSNFSSW